MTTGISSKKPYAFCTSLLPQRVIQASTHPVSRGLTAFSTPLVKTTKPVRIAARIAKTVPLLLPQYKNKSFTRNLSCPTHKLCTMSTEPPSDKWDSLVLKHLGTWEGTYTKVDAKTGDFIERHRCKLEIGVRGEKYSQRNTYTWDDGREEVYVFPGRLGENGSVEIESERLKGYSVSVSDDLLMFYAEMKTMGMDVWDCIRLLGESKRVRTWQIVSGGELIMIVSVREERISADNVYFEIENTPWN